MLVAAKLKAKKYAVVRNFHFNKELKCTCFDNTPCYMCSSTRVCKKVCVPFFLVAVPFFRRWKRELRARSRNKHGGKQM